MSVIPTVRCSRMAASLAFYTELLDFEVVDREQRTDDPAFLVLVKRGAPLFLSSHAGDGVPGQAVAVLVDDVDEVYRYVRARGHEAPNGRASPVHRRPVDQTWGTREFYVDDPDGNTIRFIQGLRILPG